MLCIYVRTHSVLILSGFATQAVRTNSVLAPSGLTAQTVWTHSVLTFSGFATQAVRTLSVWTHSKTLPNIVMPSVQALIFLFCLLVQELQPIKIIPIYHCAFYRPASNLTTLVLPNSRLPHQSPVLHWCNHSFNLGLRKHCYGERTDPSMSMTSRLHDWPLSTCASFVNPLGDWQAGSKSKYRNLIL